MGLPERTTYLEHLDECDGQVEVDLVGAHETGAVQDADGHDGSEVGSAGHFNGMPAIKKTGRPG